MLKPCAKTYYITISLKLVMCLANFLLELGKLYHESCKFLINKLDGENSAVRPPFQAPFLAKASSLPPLPSPPLFSDRKPGKRRWRRRENQLKLSTFPAISSCAVAWNRYSDHAYAAGGTLSGSSSVGLLPVVD
ncbi:hypothetical protein L3X38_035340 [Prunus dulcis]|uniref:Uncharacterized protein n=1 Tax=Prunus dulcis TaxID=3755 RepID=A0AAD4VLT8_PRUDU|nr:hypothetical protein L3X38_035340 [Prunus dulcis]